MMKTGILVAMEREYALASELARGREDMIVERSGIGKVNAAIAAWRLVREKGVSLIVNTGCAGGVDPSVGIGDALVATGSSYWDVWCGTGNERGQVQGLPTIYRPDEALLSRLREGLSGDSSIRFGHICSGDSFVESSADDERIKAIRPDALACDMELAAIAQVCHLTDTPWLAFKIISDTHSADADRSFALYEDFWQRLAGESFSVLSRLLDLV